jgi:hypothetical protein
MRERVFSGILNALDLGDLPDNVKAALVQAKQAGADRLAQTPYLQSLSADDRAGALKDVNALMNKAILSFLQSTTDGLPFMRANVLAQLARHKAVDFYFGNNGKSASDYEKGVVGVLSDITSDSGRTALERLVAAKTLGTYIGRLSGNDAISSIKTGLLRERVTASTNAQRRAIEAILAALGLNN